MNKKYASLIVVYILLISIFAPFKLVGAVPNPVWKHGDQEVLLVAVSTDGEYVVAAGKSSLYLYNRTGSNIWIAPLPEEPKILALSPDSRYVIIGGAKKIYVFETQHGNLLWTKRTKTTILSIALYEAGIIVGTLLDVQVYDYNGNSRLNIYPERYYSSSSDVTLGIGNGYLVDTNGKNIVVAGDKIYYYDIRGVWGWDEPYDPHPDNTIDKNFNIVKISQDSRHVIAADSNFIWILDSNGNLVDKLVISGTTHLECIPQSNYFAITTDRNYIYVIAYDGNIKWSRHLTYKINDLTVSKKYVSVATSSGVKIFDVASGDLVNEYNLGNIVSIDSASTKEYLVAGGDGVYFFNFNYGTLIVRSEPQGARLYINGEYEGMAPIRLTFDPGSYEILAIMKGYYPKTTTVNLDVGETKEVTLTLDPHPGLRVPPSPSPDSSTPSIERLPLNYSTIELNEPISAVKLTPDGKHLIVGSYAGKVYKFEITGKKLWEYDTGGSVLDIGILNDGKSLAVLSAHDSNQDGALDSGEIIALDGNGKTLWKYTPPAYELLSSIATTSSRVVAGGDGKIIKLTDQGYLVSEDTTEIEVPDVASYNNYLAISHAPWFYDSENGAYNELQVLYRDSVKYTKKFSEAIVGTALSRKYVAVIMGLHLDEGNWVSSEEYYLYLYNLNGQEVTKFELDHPGVSVDMTTSGDLIVAGDLGGNIYLFNGSLELISKFNLGSPVYSVSISENGELISAGTQNGKVVVVTLPGGVNIDTLPGAKVFLEKNGQQTLLGNAPINGLSLSPGVYKLTIVKKYYYPKTVEVKIEKGKVTRLHVPLERATGEITITSNAEGATVIIDGKAIGTTPIQNYKLEAGEHEITVKADGYCDEYSKKISVDYNISPLIINANLTPCPAILKIDAPKNAKVYVNGNLIGRGIREVHLTPGKYTIKAEQERKKTYITTITLDPGETKVLEIKLETDVVYYIVRVLILILIVVTGVVLFKLYTSYKFRGEYQKLLNTIASMTSQNLPSEAEGIVKELDKLKADLQEAYKNKDREKLSEIGKAINSHQNRLKEIILQYSKLKTETISDITRLTAEGVETTERPEKGLNDDNENRL